MLILSLFISLSSSSPASAANTCPALQSELLTPALVAPFNRLFKLVGHIDIMISLKERSTATTAIAMAYDQLRSIRGSIKLTEQDRAELDRIEERLEGQQQRLR